MEQSANEQVLTELVTRLSKASPELGQRISEIIPSLKYKTRQCSGDVFVSDRLWTTFCKTPPDRFRIADRPYLLLRMAVAGVLKPVETDDIGYSINKVMGALKANVSLNGGNANAALMQIQSRLQPKARQSENFKIIGTR